MKRPGKKLHRAINVFSALVLVAVALASPAVPASSTSVPTPATIGARDGRQQFGAVASGSIVVWQDVAAVADPVKDTELGTSDILGFDFSTNQQILVTNAPGDQKAPAISGSIVVWHENAHSAPGGERDIRAKDLRSGIQYDVATGAADQSFPAIDGKTVVWMEGDATGLRLVSADVEGQNRAIIAAADPNSSFRRPVMSSDLIVWSEFTVEGKAVHHVIHAYVRATGEVRTVGESDWTGTNYAVSGQRVVWTDPSLKFTDLATGKQLVLDNGPASSPAIMGSTVVWAGPGVKDSEKLDLYGADIQTGISKPLVVGGVTKHGPTIVGDRLVWQSETSKHWELSGTPLAQAFAEPVTIADTSESIPTPADAGGTNAVLGSASANTPSDMETDTTTFTRPTYKGIHVANSTDGWNNINGQPWITDTNGVRVYPAIDALGAAQNSPYFGSYVVNSGDLGRSTGRTSPWGPYVKGALRNLQADYGARVVVRTWPLTPYDQNNPNLPTYSKNGATWPEPPGSTNPSSPDWVAQEVVNLATNYVWIHDVQIENEPNLAWLSPTGTYTGSWTYGGHSPTYTWNNMFDDQKYFAINAWYIDVRYAIDWHRTSDPNLSQTAKDRIAAMTIWAPPMSDIYSDLDDGDNMYNKIQGMITLYSDNSFTPKGGMTYHLYPAPNSDTPGNGTTGLTNNSYRWFPTWLQTGVDNLSIRSMITEFGWNPGQMRRFNPGTAPGKDCTQYGNLRQYTIPWPTDGATHPAGTCLSKDGADHSFYDDLMSIVGNSARRHGAEVVAVWLVRGWHDPADNNVERADGVDDWGNLRNWFASYQQSSP